MPARLVAHIALAGSGNATLTNSLVTNQTAPDDSCSDNSNGSITDSGGNLQFPDPTCGATIAVADPKLGALEHNGGLP